VAPGRLLPWLPVAFGFGIALYFTAEREPAWWAAAGAALAGIALAYAARRNGLGFPLTLAFAAMAAGFAAATLHSARIAHPILQATVWSASVKGFVEVREARARSDRIVIRVAEIDGARMPEKPERVRVAVRKGTAPPVGSFVALKAHLSPPLPPGRRVEIMGALRAARGDDHPAADDGVFAEVGHGSSKSNQGVLGR
jgi:competence protein ComEC